MPTATFARTRIDQAGTLFSGSVTTPKTPTGSLHDGRVSFRVRWPNGPGATYRGQIRTDDHVEGS